MFTVQKIQKNGKRCYCCSDAADISVELVNQDRRIYIPNQMVREQGHPCLMLIWFCRPCMRAIEDALRATINYRIMERRELVLDELGVFHSELIPEKEGGQ